MCISHNDEHSSRLVMKSFLGWRMKWWRIWAKSLGEKVGDTDREADAIALIRTIWWLTHMATCIFIILNAIANHGWGLLWHV